MIPPTLSGRTRLVAFIAWPVDPVRAPRTYNPAYAARDLDWCHVPMGVHPDDLPTVLDALRRLSNLQGVNLTIPHKAAAHALCRWLTPEAAACGMVNTLRWLPEADGGGWFGTNSDGVGFVGAARAHGALDPSRPAFIAGSGGAGTAIAFALAGSGFTRLTVTDVDPARAEHLSAALRAAHPKLQVGHQPDAVAQAGLAVNATPLGTQAGDPMPFDAACLRPDATLFDIVASRQTELMAAARERGLRVLDGPLMVQHQLEHQIAFWRGEPFERLPGPSSGGPLSPGR